MVVEWFVDLAFDKLRGYLICGHVLKLTDKPRKDQLEQRRGLLWKSCFLNYVLLFYITELQQGDLYHMNMRFLAHFILHCFLFVYDSSQPSSKQTSGHVNMPPQTKVIQ
jgi:hypothetical protein